MKVSAKTFARISPPKAPEPPPITNADVPKVVSEKLAGTEQPKAWRFDVIRDENGLIKSIDARPADG